MGTGRVLIKFIRKYMENRNFNGFQCKLCQEKTFCRELSLANGTINPLSDVYQNGDIATFQCDPGYMLIPQTHFSMCTTNGTWSYDEPTCEEITVCRELTLDNGTINPLFDVYQNGDIATFLCNPGYVMIPEIHLTTCTANGTWSYDEPKCKENTVCRELTLVHGTINFFNNVSQNGDIAIFKCDPGYMLTPEIQYSICTANGTWSNNEPTCKEKFNCGELTLANGMINVYKNTSQDGDIATFECNPGYMLTPEIQFSICTANGIWSNDEPQCIEKFECRELSFSNGNTSVSSVMFFQCWTGFDEPPYSGNRAK